jgi:Spy/CpxP family protein refolding chaperone
MVFFKGRDQDAINAAFREFSQKEIQKANRPSIHKRLSVYRSLVAKKSKDKAKSKHQEVSR